MHPTKGTSATGPVEAFGLAAAWRAAAHTLRQHADAFCILAVGTVAFTIRFAFLYRAPVFLTGDSQSHFLPGYDLAVGYGFDPELRRTPGYALFVALSVWLLGEDLRGLAMAQHLAGVTTAVLTYVLGRMIFGHVVGLIAGLLVALNGALILSEHSVMTETLFGTLLVSMLVALVAAIQTGRRRWLVATGTLLGLAVLVRPVGQILVPVVPLALLILAAPRVSGPSVEHRLRYALIATAFFGAGFLLVVGPWMLRNLAEHGSLTASGGLGRSLVARTIKYDFGFFERDIVVAPDDIEGEVRQFVRGKRNTIRNSRSVRSTQAGLMNELGLTQAESDSLMRRVALQEIAQRPGYYALGSLAMAWQIVTGKEKDDALATRWTQRTDKEWVEQWEGRAAHLLAPTSPSEQYEQQIAEGLVNVYQPAVLGAVVPFLAAVGLALCIVWRRYRVGVVIGLAILAIVLASAALDGPVPRYRYPVDPLMSLLAVVGVVTLTRALYMAVRSSAGRASAASTREIDPSEYHPGRLRCHPERSEGASSSTGTARSSFATLRMTPEGAQDVTRSANDETTAHG